MPRNTSKMSPAEQLFRGLTEGASQSIENMEAEGQQELVREGGTRLPIELHGCSEDTLRQLGFTLGSVVDGDPVFREGALPFGWTVKATDHSMHSKILDERGARRGSIFYKAASYDRRANLGLERRFQVRADYPDSNDADLNAALSDGVWDNLKNDWVFKTKPMTDEERWVSKECIAWLTKHYPEHEDVTKYWDE